MAIVYDGTLKALRERIAALEAATPDLQTLLAALTHPPGYAAAADEFWIQGPDTTAPTVTAFAVDATSESLVVPVSSFTATDDVAVTGYMVTESATPPAADAAEWSASAPTSVTASDSGTITFYAWAKDAAGNVSASLSDSCEITINDSAPPTVTAFVIPSTSDSLTIPISDFTATDDVGVTGYMVTESGTPPSASAPGWSGSAPTTYVVTTEGVKTLRGWAKDAAGNVSAAVSDVCTVTLASVAAPAFDVVAGTYNADQSVSITCATSGASIYYTTDGTLPSSSATAYASPVAITVSATLRAIAIKTGMVDSPIASAAYTLQCVAPTFDPVAGYYAATQDVTLATTTSSASIRYTTDGSTPTGSSTLYASPISVPPSQGTTLKAIAIKSGWSNSAVASAFYYSNAVANSGFETVGSGASTTAASWTLAGNFAAPQRIASGTDGVSAHGGGWMLRSVHPTDQISDGTAYVVITGDEYRGSLGTLTWWNYSSAEVATTDANRKVWVSVLAYDAGASLLGRADIVSAGLTSTHDGTQKSTLPGGAWAERSLDIRTSLDATLGANLASVASVRIYLRSNTYATGNAFSIHWDDVWF